MKNRAKITIKEKSIYINFDYNIDIDKMKKSVISALKRHEMFLWAIPMIKDKTFMLGNTPLTEIDDNFFENSHGHFTEITDEHGIIFRKCTSFAWANLYYR